MTTEERVLYRSVGRALAGLRERAELSQFDFGEIGWSQSTVSDIERGVRKMNLHDVLNVSRLLAPALGWEPKRVFDDLWDAAENPNPRFASVPVTEASTSESGAPIGYGRFVPDLHKRLIGADSLGDLRAIVPTALPQ